MSNFKLHIWRGGGPAEIIELGDNAVIHISQKGTDNRVRARCITRPDLWLESRVNIISDMLADLTHATILESDPVRDPNHWLKRSDEEVGKYVKLKAVNQAVRNRRHNVRHGSKAGKRKVQR
jgi:hypothetical protein